MGICTLQYKLVMQFTCKIEVKSPSFLRLHRYSILFSPSTFPIWHFAFSGFSSFIHPSPLLVFSNDIMLLHSIIPESQWIFPFLSPFLWTNTDSSVSLPKFFLTFSLTLLLADSSAVLLWSYIPVLSHANLHFLRWCLGGLFRPGNIPSQQTGCKTFFRVNRFSCMDAHQNVLDASAPKNNTSHFHSTEVILHPNKQKSVWKSFNTQWNWRKSNMSLTLHSEMINLWGSLLSSLDKFLPYDFVGGIMFLLLKEIAGWISRTFESVYIKAHWCPCDSFSEVQSSCCPCL